MTARHRFEFETIRGQPKGSTRWVFRCKCGDVKCEATFVGPYRDALEAGQEAERFAAASFADEAERWRADIIVDGGSARH
ncbi:MAG: hypothetical protein AB7V13_13520 [Pseudorhodoplanes sp.]